MKNILHLFIVILIVFCHEQLKAQLPFNTVNYIDVNKIKAAVAVHGDLFWDPATQNPQCEFPKGSGKHANAISAIWMSGYDANNKLHVAAQTYRQDGNDYWPGPLDSTGQLSYAQSQLWNRVWKIDRTDIVAFKALGSHTIANTPASIMEWPARNNIYAKGYNGNIVVIGERDMAPFIDVNKDGRYNPLDGDYPDIKGEQMLWWIFSDNGPTHNNHSTTTTASAPLKVEVQACAYAYSRGTLIDNVVYYEYTISNKSADNYTGFRFGIFDDADLGSFKDDYIGFDSTHRMSIVYNGKTYDGDGSSLNEYHSSIPVTGLTLLHTPGDNASALEPAGSFMYYNNDLSVFGNPTCDTEYSHYMRSRFRDGQHLRNDFGGPNVTSNGRGAGPDANYVFSGGIDNKNGWSECTASNPARDARFILSTGDHALNAGATTKVAFAFVVTDTMQNNGCPAISSKDIKEVADTAWANYVYTAPPSTVSVANVSRVKTLGLYPNPVHDMLYLDVKDALPGDKVAVFDVTGRMMPVEVNKERDRISIDVKDMAEGVYNVMYISGNNRQLNIFIKQ